MSWLDFIFPKKCVNCGQWGQYVCESCEVGLWEEEQICPVCGRASRYGMRHKYCHQSYALDGLTCLWAYEGVARKIIAKAKYRFYYDMLNELLRGSKSLGMPGQARLRDSLVIVPVPLYSKREKWRGFNQAEMIGRWLAQKNKLELSNLLVRVKDTGQQVGKSREARLANMRGAFKLRAAIDAPRAVLLVDDVWTSGATMSECSRVLKKAGVKYVWGWVLAR
jgi:competence protein ComFC